MAGHGLSEEERGRLSTAGFSMPVVMAISREAATMRLLALRRQSGTLWSAIAAGLAVVIAGVLNIFEEGFGWVATIGIPVAASLIALGPWLEVRMMRQHEPVRWAARRLAVLAVTAKPDGAGNADWRDLLRHAGRVQNLENPRSVFRHLARAMIEDDTGINPRNPAPNRTLTVDQAQLADTVWAALAILALLALIGFTIARALIGGL